MGLGAVGGAGPSDGSGGFGGGGADGITGGSDSGGGSEHDGGRADSCGSCSEGGFGGLGIDNPGSYGGEQSMDGDTEEEENNSSNSKNQEDDSVNVSQDKLFDSYNQAPSSSMAFNGIEDFARSLSATGGPPPGVTSSDIPETDPAEVNEEETQAEPGDQLTNKVEQAVSDIFSGIGTAIVQGVKGAISAIDQAACDTYDIATNGHPLAKTALGIALVSELPAAFAAGYTASTSSLYLSTAPAIHNMLMGPIKGNPPISVAIGEAQNMIDSIIKPEDDR